MPILYVYKNLNILEASGDVEIKDNTRNYNINTKKLLILKMKRKLLLKFKRFNLEMVLKLTLKYLNTTDQSIKL